MKSSLVVIAGLLLMVFLVTTNQKASSQNANSSSSNQSASKQKGKPKVTELKATRGEKSRGGEADPNIKESKETNDPNAMMDAPPTKGGATTRGGGYCEVQFDNRTKFYIKLFVDGNYRGTLSPYGDAVVYALPGSTTVYARADFDDGSFSYWGPSSYSCGPGQYIPFRMMP
ncbi:MAG TPA: hypothetical protein VIG25_14495 [Pyrinomonadaceae bacterium]